MCLRGEGHVAFEYFWRFHFGYVLVQELQWLAAQMHYCAINNYWPCRGAQLHRQVCTKGSVPCCVVFVVVLFEKGGYVSGENGRTVEAFV